jgi:MFS family permease
MVVAAMALIGIGCAPVLMASLFIFARIYHAGAVRRAASWLIAFGALGNVIGAAPLANAAQAFGWRPVMVGARPLHAGGRRVDPAILVRDPAAPRT